MHTHEPGRQCGTVHLTLENLSVAHCRHCSHLLVSRGDEWVTVATYMNTRQVRSRAEIIRATGP